MRVLRLALGAVLACATLLLIPAAPASAAAAAPGWAPVAVGFVSALTIQSSAAGNQVLAVYSTSPGGQGSRNNLTFYCAAASTAPVVSNLTTSYTGAPTAATSSFGFTAGYGTNVAGTVSVAGADKCSGTDVVRWVRAQSNNGNDLPAATWYTYMNGCSTSAYGNVTAGIVAGSASVSFRFLGTPVPATVAASFAATGGAVTVTARPVASDPRWFYGSATTAATLPASASLPSTSCGEGVTVGAVAASATTGGTGATDPGSGEDCGLNPFCYTKAALTNGFMPQAASLSQFSGLGATFSTKIPFCWLGALGTLWNQAFTNGSGVYSYDGLFTLPTPALGNEGASSVVVLPADSGMVTWLRTYRDALGVLLWLMLLGPLALWVWRALMPIAGGGQQ